MVSSVSDKRTTLLSTEVSTASRPCEGALPAAWAGHSAGAGSWGAGG